jgi:hypothetical protein
VPARYTEARLSYRRERAHGHYVLAAGAHRGKRTDGRIVRCMTVIDSSSDLELSNHVRCCRRTMQALPSACTVGGLDYSQSAGVQELVDTFTPPSCEAFLDHRMLTKRGRDPVA